MKIKIGFVSNTSKYFDVSYAENHYDYMVNRLKSSVAEDNIEIVSLDSPMSSEDDLTTAISLFEDERIDALIFQAGTFDTGIIPLRMCQSFNTPIALWALKEPDLSQKVLINSLCGVNLVSSSLDALNRKYKFFYSHPDDDEVYKDFRNYFKAIRAMQCMKKSKVGYVGGRAIGFYPCLFDEMKLRKVFGTEVLTVGLSKINDYKIDKSKINLDELDKENYETLEGGYLTEEDIIDQESTFLTLKNFVEDHRFDALTIRDWPELLDDEDLGGVWPAVGRLHDEVMITGPEGDMPGTITMMIENYISNKKPFLTDMVYFNEEDDTVYLWHYGGAPSLAKDNKKIKYSEDNFDVEFTLRPGIITIARLHETGNGYKMLLSRGQVLDEDVTIERTGAKVKLEGSASDFLNEVIYGGWAHHICTIEGDYLDSLIEFCNLLDIETVVLN